MRFGVAAVVLVPIGAGYVWARPQQPCLKDGETLLIEVINEGLVMDPSLRSPCFSCQGVSSEMRLLHCLRIGTMPIARSCCLVLVLELLCLLASKGLAMLRRQLSQHL